MKMIIILMSVFLLVGQQACAQESLRQRIDRRLDSISPAEQQTPLGAQVLIDVLRLEVMPGASLPDRKEAEELSALIAEVQSGKIGDPGSVPVLRALGEVTTRFNDLMVKIDPTNFDRHYDRAEAFEQVAAMIELNNGLNRPPDESLILMAEGLNRKAVEASRKLVKDFPKEPHAYGLLAYQLYVFDKKYAEAEKVARQCLAINKDFQYCKDLIADFKADRNRIK